MKYAQNHIVRRFIRTTMSEYLSRCSYLHLAVYIYHPTAAAITITITITTTGGFSSKCHSYMFGVFCIIYSVGWCHSDRPAERFWRWDRSYKQPNWNKDLLNRSIPFVFQFHHRKCLKRYNSTANGSRRNGLHWLWTLSVKDGIHSIYCISGAKLSILYSLLVCVA